MKAVICLDSWKEVDAMEGCVRPDRKELTLDITSDADFEGFPKGSTPKFYVDLDTFKKIRPLLDGTHVLEIRLNNVSQ